MYFRNYRLSKAWVDHSLKSVVSEYPSTVNMLKGPEDLWNLHENTFIIFFNHSEGKWFGKYLPYWSLKSKGCLLAHWLPMKSMLVQSVRICSSRFKWYDLKHETSFLKFSLICWNIHQILNIFKKKKIVIADVFPKLQTAKHLLTPLSKKLRFKKSFDSQNVKGSQTLVKFPLENFYQIFSSCSGELIWEISPWLKIEIIGVFVNTLTVDYKYPVPDCENLWFPIQVPLS